MNAAFAYIIWFNFSFIFLSNGQSRLIPKPFIFNENISPLDIFCPIFLTVQLHVTKLHSATEPLSCTKEDESFLPALSMREVDLTPAPLFFRCLPCMIRSPRARTRPLWKHCPPPHHLTVLLLLCFSIFFFSTPALISAEETSQCRSCQSRTWGSACWECFWGSCWRSLLTDPTPCLGHPGGTKVRLDYAWCYNGVVIGLIKLSS